jgi:hypothetical protein
MSDDYTTELNLLPVCSCGFVYTSGIEVKQDIKEKDGIKYSTYEFIPSYCPNCRKKIVSITKPKYM